MRDDHNPKGVQGLDFTLNPRFSEAVENLRDALVKGMVDLSRALAPVVVRHERDFRTRQHIHMHVSGHLNSERMVIRHCDTMLRRARSIEDGYARHAAIRYWRGRRRAAMKKEARLPIKEGP